MLPHTEWTVGTSPGKCTPDVVLSLVLVKALDKDCRVVTWPALAAASSTGTCAFTTGIASSRMESLGSSTAAELWLQKADDMRGAACVWHAAQVS